MSSVIIDRRKNDKGKSSINRKKFLTKVRGVLKDSVKDVIRNGNLKDLASSSGKKVKIPVRDLGEHTFRHDGTGVNDLVVPGNDQHVVGDKIKRRKKGSQPGGSDKGEGEDSFTFNLTKEEFDDIFFDNCALPDLIKETIAVMTEETIQRVGFSPSGSPSQLSVSRSMRNAKSRRFGLKAAKHKKLKQLEEKKSALILEIESRKAHSLNCSLEEVELRLVEEELTTVRRKLRTIPFIDPNDLRFNTFAKVSSPKIQAVMICLMDVSGSMTERKKELAKTFYLLLYLFLTRQYDSIVIEYITYHVRAHVVDEENFYHGLQTGGTIASSGVELLYETIMSKYSPALWNIYVAHASDGDNFPPDNSKVEELIVNQILPIVQYYAYVDIDPDSQSTLYFGDGSEPTTLLDIFTMISLEHENINVAQVSDESDVYEVFLKLFKRK